MDELLPGAPLDHHGKAIADIIPKCIKRGLDVSRYLDARILTTSQVSRCFRQVGCIPRVNMNPMGFVCSVPLHTDLRVLKNQIFKPNLKNNRERDVRTRLIDLPIVCDPNS